MTVTKKSSKVAQMLHQSWGTLPKTHLLMGVALKNKRALPEGRPFWRGWLAFYSTERVTLVVCVIEPEVPVTVTV